MMKAPDVPTGIISRQENGRSQDNEENDNNNFLVILFHSCLYVPEERKNEKNLTKENYSTGNVCLVRSCLDVKMMAIRRY